MQTVDEIINSIEIRATNSEQETRIRELSKRVLSAFRAGSEEAVQHEIESDWHKLAAQFSSAFERVKKDTGLF